MKIMSRPNSDAILTSVELCAGAGGQALGLEQAGFHHVALFDNDTSSCQTLKHNRPNWRVEHQDLFSDFEFDQFRGVDLLAGGLPCPPFSIAGKQLGEGDERNLFTRGVDLVEIIQPRAVMFENVRGMMSKSFDSYRAFISEKLSNLGYVVSWHLLNASDFGVPQLRPRVIMIAINVDFAEQFRWPKTQNKIVTVADSISDLMAENNWLGIDDWKASANSIAPTLVGGSKKHGGPDLGPTRARQAWAKLGVNGSSLAESAPSSEFIGMPRLTVKMAARLQGFPDSWEITGKKTPAYRQVGNAFPPPVAKAVGFSIRQALTSEPVILQAAE